MTKDNQFLPDDYEIPQIDGDYMKFRDGENAFRILSTPIRGWELWINNTPKRFREDEEIPVEVLDSADVNPRTGKPRPPKYFWAMVVWNRNAKPKAKLQILEITQRGIQKAIKALNKSKAWGNPIGANGYDILVNKEGEGIETEYSVTPSPKEKLDSSIIKEFKEANINLEALFDGDDPFVASSEDIDPDEVDEIIQGV